MSRIKFKGSWVTWDKKCPPNVMYGIPLPKTLIGYIIFWVRRWIG